MKNKLLVNITKALLFLSAILFPIWLVIVTFKVLIHGFGVIGTPIFDIYFGIPQAVDVIFFWMVVPIFGVIGILYLLFLTIKGNQGTQF